ncbi:MAG: site-2 protease family protein [Alphaproteobacteria bacterium]|nr:site-2 protease family protein [Alphaproteobacteria bacterium]
MESLLAEFGALFVYGPLIVILHELGHALFARRGGYRVTSFGIGLGPPLWTLRLSGPLVVHLDRWVLAGGACIAIPDGPPTARRIWFHAGGLIAQALLAVVLLLLPDHWLVDRILHFNVLVALTNAVPWKVGGNASDGWYILDALSGGRRTGNILYQRAIFEQMAAREFAIGSPMGIAYADLCVTWADVLAGRLEEADEFFHDDPAETAAHPWTDALYHYVKAEWHREHDRPLAALSTARDGRNALGAGTGANANALLALAEARALVALDEPDRARRALQRVAGGPLATQALPLAVWCSLDADDTEDLELASWKVARHIQGPWLDPVDPTLALVEAAEELSRRGRLNAARSARDAATDLARRTLRSAAIEDRRTLSYRLRQAIHTPVEAAVAEGSRKTW